MSGQLVDWTLGRRLQNPAPETANSNLSNKELRSGYEFGHRE